MTTQGRTVRVITTHPEDASPVVQQAQADELLSGPASTFLPVIIAGDLNIGRLAPEASSHRPTRTSSPAASPMPGP